MSFDVFSAPTPPAVLCESVKKKYWPIARLPFNDSVGG